MSDLPPCPACGSEDISRGAWKHGRCCCGSCEPYYDDSFISCYCGVYMDEDSWRAIALSLNTRMEAYKLDNNVKLQ